jgi:hypothetical protein
MSAVSAIERTVLQHHFSFRLFIPALVFLHILVTVLFLLRVMCSEFFLDSLLATNSASYCHLPHGGWLQADAGWTPKRELLRERERARTNDENAAATGAS